VDIALTFRLHFLIGAMLVPFVPWRNMGFSVFNSLMVLIAALTLGVGATAIEQGNMSRGQGKASECATCHGPDGNSESPEWPKLAGLDHAYIVTQLQAYKAGDRQDAVMWPIAIGLSDQDMRDLGTFFASQKPRGTESQSTDKALVAAGERIYQQGIAAKTVAACASCHGPAATGQPATGSPRLGGQHAQYLAAQLQAFRTRQRPDPTNTMRELSEKMSEEEMRAVAAYVAGLSGQ
jgi:cytochrome c553